MHKSIPISHLYAALCAAVITFLALALFATAVYTRNQENIQYLGQFGDAFGILNPLFSILAFGGAIYSITLQTNQHHADKQHDQEMIIRSKLEDLLRAVRAIQTEMISSAAKIVNGSLEPGLESLPRAFKPIEITEVYVHLYFPSLIELFNGYFQRSEITLLLADYREALPESGEKLVQCFLKSCDDSGKLYRAILNKRAALIAEGLTL